MTEIHQGQESAEVPPHVLREAGPVLNLRMLRSWTANSLFQSELLPADIDNLNANLLKRVEELVEEYPEMLESRDGSAAEAVDLLYRLLTGENTPCRLEALHKLCYEPDDKVGFFNTLLAMLEKQTENEELSTRASIYIGERQRRHRGESGNWTCISKMSVLVSQLEEQHGLRSSAEYEGAMAYGNLGDIEAKLQWLEVSGWSSIKAGDEVNGNATVSEVLKAKLDRGDDAAELAERIAQQRTKHAELEANATNDNDRQTSGRWVMNSDYHLALIAEKNRDADELCRLIGLLDESDYVDLMVEGELDRLKEVLRELMRSDVI